MSTSLFAASRCVVKQRGFHGSSYLAEHILGLRFCCFFGPVSCGSCVSSEEIIREQSLESRKEIPEYMVSPYLHDSILRLMFEYAAWQHKGSAARLVLVSRTVNKWIDKILYSSVTLRRQSTTKAFLNTLQITSKSPSYFEENVKSLCISVDFQDNLPSYILNACRGAQNLTLWTVPVTYSNSTLHSVVSIEAALAKLRPRRVVMHLHHVLRAPYPQFHLPFFQDITHLTIKNRWEDWTTWKDYELLHSLTHICFQVGLEFDDLFQEQAFRLSRFMKTLLPGCPRLQVVVLLFSFDRSPMSTKETAIDVLGIDDNRVVYCYEQRPFQYYDSHSLEALKMWEAAEDAQRKADCLGK